MAEISGKEAVGLTGLQISLVGTQFFSSALPSIYTIREAPQRYSRHDIRRGEVFGAGATIALGWIASTVIDDRTPLFMAVVVSLLMVGVYEAAMSTREGPTEHE